MADYFSRKTNQTCRQVKNDSFCFTMMSWSVEGLLLSRCLSFHWNTISGLMLMYTVAPWSKFTASFVVIRIVFEVQISITEIICIVNTRSTCKIVKHKVHVKHLNCTCMYTVLEVFEEIFSLDQFIHYLLIH